MFFFKKKKKVETNIETAFDFKFPEANKDVITEDMQNSAMIRFCNTKKGKTFDDTFPVYLKREYLIDNPKEFLNNLVDKGFVYVTDKGTFKPTEKGIILYREYEWMFIISHYNISKEEYLSYRFSPNVMDNIWGILNSKCLEYTKSQQFGLLRNCYYYMASILEKEKKYAAAMQNYILVQYYDLSGWGNSGFSESHFFIFPAIAECIAAYKEYFNESYIDDAILSTPSSLVTKQQFTEIIYLIMNKQEVDLNKYIEKR